MKLAYTAYKLFSLGHVKQNILQIAKFLFSKVNPALLNTPLLFGQYVLRRAGMMT